MIKRVNETGVTPSSRHSLQFSVYFIFSFPTLYRLDFFSRDRITHTPAGLANATSLDLKGSTDPLVRRLEAFIKGQQPDCLLLSAGKSGELNLDAPHTHTHTPSLPRVTNMPL